MSAAACSARATGSPVKDCEANTNGVPHGNIAASSPASAPIGGLPDRP
jgi:hypothetical protein